MTPVSILGIPYDANSSFLRGAAHAPARIREVLHAGSGNYCTQHALDLSKISEWKDVGDLPIKQEKVPEAFGRIQREIRRLLSQGERILSLGGDHSITFPIIQEYSKHYPQLHLLQIDAHGDLYDNFEDNPYSHASPFARIMEQNLVASLTQVGIRTLTPHQWEQVARFEVQVFEMKDWTADTDLQLKGPLYISLDIDAFDPAFAPGVAHHEPGGFTTREVLGLIDQIQVPIVGADIVELNPQRDPTGITAMLAAKFLKELSGKMLQ